MQSQEGCIQPRSPVGPIRSLCTYNYYQLAHNNNKEQSQRQLGPRPHFTVEDLRSSEIGIRASPSRGSANRNSLYPIRHLFLLPNCHVSTAACTWHSNKKLAPKTPHGLHYGEEVHWSVGQEFQLKTRLVEVTVGIVGGFLRLMSSLSEGLRFLPKKFDFQTTPLAKIVAMLVTVSFFSSVFEVLHQRNLGHRVNSGW